MINRYTTSHLPFAAYLHSTRRLRFLGCEPNGNGRVAFVFDDAKGEGSHLHIRFESGAECPAVGFYDSIRHLRRVMDGTIHDHRSMEQYDNTHRR